MRDTPGKEYPAASQARNRRFLLTVIFLLGLLIIASLAVIALILTEPQPQSSLAQAAQLTATADRSSMAATATAASTPPPTATARRLIPPSKATPEIQTHAGAERIVDYAQAAEGAHRIVRYADDSGGAHRIVVYRGAEAEEKGDVGGQSGTAEAPRRGGRIIPYGSPE